jgi:hypothetical protein|tara:strand:+ start:102 stop:539 length:438 start_codon:yes stop_codon:yes gene_type:complete
MSKILSSFTLTNVTRQAAVVDKARVRREKVSANLFEQNEIAKAMLEGREYVAIQIATNEDGETVEKQKRIKHWFYNNGNAEWFLEIRYANKAMELQKGKTAIVVANKNKLVETIELAIKAVESGELDTAISKVAEDKKRSFKKAS